MILPEDGRPKTKNKERSLTFRGRNLDGRNPAMRRLESCHWVVKKLLDLNQGENKFKRCLLVQKGECFTKFIPEFDLSLLLPNPLNNIEPVLEDSCPPKGSSASRTQGSTEFIIAGIYERPPSAFSLNLLDLGIGKAHSTKVKLRLISPFGCPHQQVIPHSVDWTHFEHFSF